MTEPQKLWLDALRSGKYKQTKEVLKDKNGYCCLGVLCQLYNDNVCKIEEPMEYHMISNSEDMEQGKVCASFDSECQVLPRVVQKWVGLKDSIGRLGGCSLTIMNDEGKTLSEIADTIEQNQYKLFVE